MSLRGFWPVAYDAQSTILAVPRGYGDRISDIEGDVFYFHVS